MLHVAVMVQRPYLSYVVLGRKTVEFRYTINKIAPYLGVEKDDIIYFKPVGIKMVRYYATVENVEFVTGHEKCVEMLRKYMNEACINENYINSKPKGKYLSSIWLKDVKAEVKLPLFCYKQDRRTWIRNVKIENGDISEIKC